MATSRPMAEAAEGTTTATEPAAVVLADAQRTRGTPSIMHRTRGMTAVFAPATMAVAVAAVLAESVAVPEQQRLSAEMEGLALIIHM